MGRYKDYLQWRADTLEVGLCLPDGALYDFSFAYVDDGKMDFFTVLYDVESQLDNCAYKVVSRLFKERGVKWNYGFCQYVQRVSLADWCVSVKEFIEENGEISYSDIENITKNAMDDIKACDDIVLCDFDKYSDDFLAQPFNFYNAPFDELVELFYGNVFE